jgi:hypothetical protein
MQVDFRVVKLEVETGLSIAPLRCSVGVGRDSLGLEPIAGDLT